MKQDLMHKDVNDVNITPEERRSIWQLWRQNLKDWAWYIREIPTGWTWTSRTAVSATSSPPAGGLASLRSLATRRSAGSFRSPKTAWPSCCCSPGAVCPGWARACGSGLPAPQAQHPPQRQHPGLAGAAAPAPGHLPGHLRHGGGGDRAAVGIHHRHHRPL